MSKRNTLLWVVSMVAMSITLNAQQPADSTVAVTGWFIERGFVDLSNEVKSYIFIKEKMQIAFNDEFQKAYYMMLDEASAQRLGRSQVAVVFLNDTEEAGVHYKHQTANNPVTLNLTALDPERIPYAYYCKDSSWIKPTGGTSMYYQKQIDLRRLMDDPKEGDTLRYGEGWIDSRYTPQLVRALSNSSTIVIEAPIHDSHNNSYMHIPKKMAELARKRLDNIFSRRVSKIKLNSPTDNAPVQEWQAWLDSLPRLILLMDVEHDIPFKSTRMKDQRGAPYGNPMLTRLAAVAYDPITDFIYTHDGYSMYAFDTKKDTAFILDVVNLPINKPSVESGTPNDYARSSGVDARFSNKPIVLDFPCMLALPNGNVAVVGIRRTAIQEVLTLQVDRATGEASQPLCVASHIPFDNSTQMQLVGLYLHKGYYYIAYRIKEYLVWCKVDEGLLE